MVRKKEFRLKGFISLEEINLSRQTQNYGFYLINHGIFPPNMLYNTIYSVMMFMHRTASFTK